MCDRRQAELARRAGLSASAIKAYENGGRHPSPEVLSAIVDALGLTPDQANPILTGAGYSVDLRWLIHGRYSSPEVHALQEESEHIRGRCGSSTRRRTCWS